MSDYYRVSAPVVTRRGVLKTYGILVRESDSEVIPTWQKHMMLAHALADKRLKIVGPAKVEVANADGSLWDPKQGPHDAHYWAWRMKDYPHNRVAKEPT